jgi:hypothetical protein
MFLTRKQMLTGFFVARVIEKEDEPGRARRRFESGRNLDGFGDRDLRLPPHRRVNRTGVPVLF